jgi:hypothetical protein
MLRAGEWMPDLPELENPGALEALGVIPDGMGYAPFPQMAAYSGSISATCQGAFSTRGPDLAAYQFAGDNNKLYKLENGGTTWSNVTRTLSVYATPTDGRWYFTKFGDTVVAVNGFDEPQSYVTGTSTQFANLGGSPPVAATCTTIREFVVLGRIASFPTQVRWSGFSDPTTWTVDAITQASFKTIEDGGIVQNIVGGEFGVVLQERAIRRMIYAGPPFTFQFDKISTEIGCTYAGSIANFENQVYFADASGFFLLHGGQDLHPIGNNKVDNFFAEDLDQSYLHKMWAAINPEKKLYAVLYAGAGNVSGTPNHMLIYQWADQKWARVEVTAEMIYSGLSQGGYTLEQLDAFGTMETLPFSLDSPVWAGVARRLLAAFDTSHRLNYFNGAPMAATIDTSEQKPANGKKAFLRSCRPIVDGGSPTVALITRDTPQETVAIGSDVALDSLGRAKFRRRARYVRARIKIPAGDTWTHAQGIDDIVLKQEGER